MLHAKFVAASIVALGLTAPPAFAQDAVRTDADIQFQQYDKDNKGYLTRTDVANNAQIAQQFVKFDANRDGKLDRGEFAALIAALR